MTQSKLKTMDVRKSENGEEITKQELLNLQAEAAKVADLEKAAVEADTLKSELDTLKGALGGMEVSDLLKAAQELADLKKAQEEKVLEDTKDVVKGFNLFEEEKVEDIAKFFVKNAGEEANLIIASLEKARDSIKEFGEAEHGTDLEGETQDVQKADVAALSASVADILKKRKSEK